MKYFVANRYSSELCSDDYIRVNNFGVYENLSYDVGVNRPFGRVDYQIIIILSGTGKFTINSKIHILGEGSGIIYRPGETQIYNIDKTNSYLWIHFTGSQIEAIFKKLRITEIFLHNIDCSKVKNILHKMTETSVYPKNIAEEMANSYLLAFLVQLCVSETVIDPGISKVIMKMKNEKFQSLSIKEYAKIAGLSECQFIRKFRKNTKMTPHQYKSRIIADEASRLLQTTTLNISQIADCLGFDDSLYFSRFFKKMTGISPKNYRSNITKEG